MLASASSTDPSNSLTAPSLTHSDESLSWQQLTETTMTDTEYKRALTSASADQRVAIDKVFTHNRSRIVNDCKDQLLLFVTEELVLAKATSLEPSRKCSSSKAITYPCSLPQLELHLPT